MDQSTGANSGPRMSELVNADAPPGSGFVRDQDILVTCPKCGTKRDMYSCDVRFQWGRTTYRCPDDQTVLARVFSGPDGEPERMESKVNLDEIDYFPPGTRPEE